MKKVTLSKMTHKGDTRIRVDFPYDAAIIQTIKQLDGSRWSQSKKCWHLPYSKENYQLLQKHFAVTIHKESKPTLSTSSSVAVKKENHQEVISTDSSEVIQVLPEHDFRVKVIVPWQRKDWVTLIKTFPNRAWNKEQKYWSVPKTKATLLLLQKLFGKAVQVDSSIDWQTDVLTNKSASSKSATSGKPTQKKVDHSSNKDTVTVIKSIPSDLDFSNFKTIQKDGRTIKIVVGQKIILEQASTDWIRVFIPYDKKGWIAIVKDIPNRKWQADQTCWLVPYVQDTFKRLWTLIGKDHIEVTFSIQADIPKESKPSKEYKERKVKFQLNEVQQSAVTALEGKMQLENKRWKTRKTYRSLFIRFLAYFPNTKPSAITKEQIEQYIIYRKQDNISDSQLNQLINTLNCFYIRLLKQDDKVVHLERPTRKRKLPNVYATEEVQLLLKAPTN